MRGRLASLAALFIIPTALAFAPSIQNGRAKSLIVLRQSERSLADTSGGRRAAATSAVETKENYWQAYQAPQELVATIPRPSSSSSSAMQETEMATTAISDAPLVSEQEYRRGLVTIGFCTLVFASMSPVMHAALAGATAPPVLLINAAVSTLALAGLVLSGPLLERIIPKPSTLQEQDGDNASKNLFLDTTTRAGLELGLWKFLGTTANLYGLSLTTADHGAFLVQLTTLIVPVVQGIMGVPIPQRIQVSVALALGGVALFTQDHVAGAVVPPNQSLGDLLCVVAAIFYATYDLRLFSWGKLVAARELITSKIGTQALFSVLLLLGAGWNETVEFFSQGDGFTPILIGLILWSGFMVNAIVPFLQVGGQQAIGPTRSQTIYASQPLWAGIMSFVFLNETIGLNGAVGGAAFLAALFLAATAEAPDPNCGEKNCEV